MRASEDDATHCPAPPANEPEDSDPEETREWLDSPEAMVTVVGPKRVTCVLKQLELRAQQL